MKSNFGMLLTQTYIFNTVQIFWAMSWVGLEVKLKNFYAEKSTFGMQITQAQTFKTVITKTCLYIFDPFKPHFYIVKLRFTGVYIIFLISAQKHRLWVLVRTAFRVCFLS